MKKYVVHIFGRNFLMENDGKRSKLGFRASCVVEVENVDEVKEAAIEIIKAHSRIDGMVLNDVDDPPVIFPEKMVELDSSDYETSSAVIFEFFSENESSVVNELDLDLDDI